VTASRKLILQTYQAAHNARCAQVADNTSYCWDAACDVPTADRVPLVFRYVPKPILREELRSWRHDDSQVV
jgi:hypothetical protein